MPEGTELEYLGTALPAEVAPQSIVSVMVSAVIVIALASWAFSLTKRAWKGEEIAFKEVLPPVAR